ncbi:MAG: MoaD/ThiS family protein [Acidimicrobiales bacterium]
MTRLRLFAQARDAAGGAREVELPGSSVEEVLRAAVERFGTPFADVLATSAIWVNGDEAEPGDPVGGSDEVAVLPPVSGG